MAKFTVATKPSAKGISQNTVLEVLDEGCPREVLVALATQTAVIRRQNYWRKHGIPATDSISLADFAPGKRQVLAGMTKEQLVAQAKADPAFRKALLDELGLAEAEEGAE